MSGISVGQNIDAVTGEIKVNGVLVATTTTTAWNALTSFSVNTNKFTVDFTTGNTLVAGTLGVTGLITANAGIATAINQNITGGGGTAAISGFASIGATALVGTLSTAAQPNVTSVGTLTGFTSSSMGTVTALTTNGAVALKVIARSGSEDSQIAAYRFDGTTREYLLNGTATGLQIYGPTALSAVFTDTNLSLGSNSLTAGAISGATISSSSGDANTNIGSLSYAIEVINTDATAGNISAIDFASENFGKRVQVYGKSGTLGFALNFVEKMSLSSAGLAVTGALSVSGSMLALGYFTIDGADIANATTATTLGSVGPAAAQTTVQGWLRIKVGGNYRFIPYW